MKKNRPGQLPLARTEQLIVKEVDDEVLVYDLKTDQAHCLNKTAANVWRNCDGEKSVTEIKAALANEVGAPVDEGLVWVALDQLEKFKLLQKASVAPSIFAGMSRRQLIRNLGAAAVVLPVVVSIVAPTSSEAASCVQPGAPPNATCVNDIDCCSNKCIGSAPKHCL